VDLGHMGINDRGRGTVQENSALARHAAMAMDVGAVEYQIVRRVVPPNATME